MRVWYCLTTCIDLYHGCVIAALQQHKLVFPIKLEQAFLHNCPEIPQIIQICLIIVLSFTGPGVPRASETHMHQAQSLTMLAMVLRMSPRSCWDLQLHPAVRLRFTKCFQVSCSMHPLLLKTITIRSSSLLLQ